jgi:hypothetical protein
MNRTVEVAGTARAEHEQAAGTVIHIHIGSIRNGAPNLDEK